MEPHRTTHRVRSAVAAATALLILAGPASAAGAEPVATTTPLGPVLPAPPREISPFSSPDEFCTREPAPPAPPAPAPLASAPGVSARSISVVVFVPPAGATAPGVVPVEPDKVTAGLATVVNGCGGIRGRTLDLHLVTTTTDPASECARAIDQFNPFTVVSLGAFDAGPCAASPASTVTIETGASVPRSALSGTQGRLAVGATTNGADRARLLDLVASGRLDDKRVAVVAAAGGRSTTAEIRRILRTAAPSRHIAIAPSTTDPAAATVDVVLSTGFSATTARLTRGGKHPLAVYSFGHATDAELAALRAFDERRVGGGEVYGWITPAVARYRDGADPSRFAQMCNQTSVIAALGPSGASTTTTTTTPTTTTESPTLPGGSYAQTTDICLAMRTLARSLYAAGPNPTQSSLVRALYRLPYTDVPSGGVVARPNQVVNEPPSRVRQVVVLAQASNPCPHPGPANAAATGMCWVPVPGWTDGHAVNARL